MESLVDRFVYDGARWIDAATGAVVRIHFEHAAALDAFDWDEQCGRLFNARHPLLNPLVDYGPAPGGRRFEAYLWAPSVRTAAGAAEQQLRHLESFLRAAGVSLTGPRSRCAVRAVESGPTPDTGRCLGFTLQPRRALDVTRETLETPAAAPSTIDLVAPPLAGLRTARLLIARTARLLGFVPIRAGLLLHKPAFAAAFGERHLCVFGDDDIESRRDLAQVLVAISAASARRHVVVRFGRTRAQRRTIPLDPLSVRSLVGMVIADPEAGPTEQELFEAARMADGRPGAFLAYLAGHGRETLRGAMLVHETPQEYSAEAAPRLPSGPAPRTLSAALRATARAEALMARGRHAAARRVLQRGARVLAGRQRPDAAAECLVRAGWLALDRGATADAARLFADARQQTSSGGLVVRAGIGLGETWIEDGRLLEAEAVLRGALSAAETIGDSIGVSSALAGLVRCLRIQDRATEAIASAGDVADGVQAAAVPLLSELSRCHATAGRTPAAVRLARRAQQIASHSGDPRAAAVAELALAEALGASGDLAGMREALNHARPLAKGARLPLLAITAELVSWELESADVDADTVRRVRRRLRALAALPLTRLLRERIASITQALDAPRALVAAAPVAPIDAHREAADALERLLQVGQQA